MPNTILYSINKTDSEVNNALVIDLLEGEKTAFSYQPLPKQKTLTRQLLSTLATEKEKELLDLLLKEEMLHLKKDKIAFSDNSTALNRVRCSYASTGKILKLLAAVGKLFFNNKAIAIDLFSKVELSLLLEEKEKAFAIIGKLQDYPLSEVDFICAGPPHWFIKGYSLKFIVTDISWGHLKKGFSSSWEVEKSELTTFLRDFEPIEGGHSPKIITPSLSSTKPQPLLILKDPSGAFANLWFDYGKESPSAFHDTLRSNNRCLPDEQQLEKDLLETDFIKKLVGSTHYYCPLDKVANSLSFLLEVGWKILDSKGNRVVRQNEMLLDMQDGRDSITITGKVRYEEHQADLADVVGAFNRRERFVALAPGTVGLLPERSEQLSTLSEEGELVQGTIKVHKSRFGMLQEVLEDSTTQIDEPLKALRERLGSLSGITSCTPGTSFKGELRPYQQEGLNWLGFLYQNHFHGLLADDMGLGKTVQVLAFLSQLSARSAPVLIVMPTSLLFNWKNEIEKFLDSCSLYLHHGSQRSSDLSFIEQQSLILTSYSTLRQDLALLSSLSYQCVILDEAQMIKNASTQVAQAVFSLKADFRLSITGTPIENHLGELWSQFRFLIPNLFESEKLFNAEVEASSSDRRYLERIRKMIKPFFLRRTKEEVAKDLPERIDQTVLVEMLPEQRQVYEDFLSGVKSHLISKVTLDGMAKHRMEVLEALLRLRQICCHPLLVSPENPGVSAKMDLVLQDVATALEEGKKVLIYSQFTSLLQLLAKEIRARSWPFVYLDGSTVDREKCVESFQTDKEIPLFLISLKAGGVGLNLTAADYVFLFDPWWNEAVENQAINRAHRIGRKETVIAKRYITIGTIEEKMMKMKEAKSSLAENIFQGDPNHPGIAEEDLLFLLSKT